MTVISVTERASYRGCRRRWSYGSRSRGNLTPIVGVPALDLGSLVHKALADWLEYPDANLEELFDQRFVLHMDAVRDSFAAANNGEHLPTSQPAQLIELGELGRLMLRNYQDHWGSPLPEDFDVVAPEQTIMVPIPESAHICAGCDGLGYTWDAGFDSDTGYVPESNRTTCSACEGVGLVPHYLEGTLDGLLRRKADGALYILEHKTFGVHPDPDDLETSDQFLAYLWLLGQLVAEQPDLGVVGGVAYDGLWKRKAPPRGRTMDDLFMRRLLTRSTAELAEFEHFLPDEAREMADPTTPLYPNRTRDCKWACPFEKLCRAQSRGEDVAYLQRTYYTQREALA